MPVSVSRVCWNRLSTASLEGKRVNVRLSNQNETETTSFSLHIAKNITLRSSHIFSYKMEDAIFQKIQKIQYKTLTIKYRVKNYSIHEVFLAFDPWALLWVLPLQHMWLSIFGKFQRSTTAHDTGGMRMKSAITIGKYTEFLCVHPSIHPVFWFIPSRFTRQREKIGWVGWQ